MEEGAEDDVRPVREAVAFEPGRLLRGERTELADQARLAQPRLAEEDRDLAAALGQLVQNGAQTGHLVLTVDERGCGSDSRNGLRPDQSPGGDRLLAPLDCQLAQRIEHECLEERLRRHLADDDRAGIGCGLEAGRDVRRVSQADRLGVRCADEPDRCLPRVDPDPGVEVGDFPGRLDLTAVFADVSEDRKGRTGRALRVVLVCLRNAEEGSDPIAHVCLDDAAVPFHGRVIRLTNSPITTFTSSGLRRSPSVVEPTMSANSAVTGRSSSSERALSEASAGPGATGARSGSEEGRLSSFGTGARTVPPDSAESGAIRKEVLPTRTTSPTASWREPWRRSPFTHVPFSDPRSSISRELSAGANKRVAPRDERIVDGDIRGTRSTQNELRLHREALPRERPFCHQQRGHVTSLADYLLGNPPPGTGPVSRLIVLRQTSCEIAGRHLPMKSLTGFHQLRKMVGARPAWTRTAEHVDVVRAAELLVRPDDDEGSAASR